MNPLSTKKGMGALCPSFIKRVLFIFLSLSLPWALLQAGYTGPIPLPNSIVIKLSSRMVGEPEVENLLALQSGFEECQTEVTSMAGDTELLFFISGSNEPLPPNIELGIVHTLEGGQAHQYVVKTDGGSMIVVIDDY